MNTDNITENSKFGLAKIKSMKTHDPLARKQKTY